MLDYQRVNDMQYPSYYSSCFIIPAEPAAMCAAEIRGPKNCQVKNNSKNTIYPAWDRL